MLQKYKIKTPPSVELLSREVVKSHLLIESDCTDYDLYIDILITTARKTVEDYTSMLIGEQVWNLYQDELDFETEIHKRPITAINSFKYKDKDGDLLNVSDYTDTFEDLNSLPVKIAIYDKPNLFEKGYNQIIIEFTAGITTLPEPVQSAMLLMIGHWFENRMDVVTQTSATEMPKSSEYLLRPYTNYEFW